LTRPIRLRYADQAEQSHRRFMPVPCPYRRGGPYHLNDLPSDRVVRCAGWTQRVRKTFRSWPPDWPASVRGCGQQVLALEQARAPGGKNRRPRVQPHDRLGGDVFPDPDSPAMPRAAPAIRCGMKPPRNTPARCRPGIERHSQVFYLSRVRRSPLSCRQQPPAPRWSSLAGRKLAEGTLAGRLATGRPARLAVAVRLLRACSRRH